MNVDFLIYLFDDRRYSEYGPIDHRDWRRQTTYYEKSWATFRRSFGYALLSTVCLCSGLIAGVPIWLCTLLFMMQIFGCVARLNKRPAIVLANGEK